MHCNKVRVRHVEQIHDTPINEFHPCLYELHFLIELNILHYGIYVFKTHSFKENGQTRRVMDSLALNWFYQRIIDVYSNKL